MKPLNGTDVAKRHSAEPEALADIVKRRAAEAGLLKERPLLEQQILALPSVAEGLVRPVHQETATLEAAIRLFGAHIEPPSAGRHFAADGILDVDADGDHAGAAATVKPDDLIEVAKVKDRDVGVEVTLLAKPTITPSTCAGDKLVRGFNGLPGVGPWAIGGYIRVKSLKEAKKPLELSKISVKLDAVMAGRRMVAKSNEAFVLYPHFYARLVALPVVVLGQNTTIPVGGEYVGTFRFQFTQVYPPALDLITLCAHDTKNVVLYRLGATVPGPFGQLSLLYDVPVQLFSVNLIRGWLTDTVVNPLVSMFPSSKPEILPDVHIKVGPHGWCVPGETIAIEVTVIMRPPGYSTNSASNSSAESASSIVGSISQVTVSLYEVVGFAEGSLKAGSLHPRVTVKTCVSSIAKRELNAAAEAGHQTLIWNPSAVAGAAGMTATLRLRIPPPASTRSMVPTKAGRGAQSRTLTRPASASTRTGGGSTRSCRTRCASRCSMSRRRRLWRGGA
ncbi:hypothetical protein DFJ73DRAFT_520827 [Zopfochytrium polystomum]|nr:hypothetical protein DFJ73DRAFT_520827 [Zopfochytrium polystomum]